MGLFEFFFNGSAEEEALPIDGYLASPPGFKTILKPGKYYFQHREVVILGFFENGHMCATIFLCLGGDCECSEWNTLAFHRLSRAQNEETWEATVGRNAVIIEAKEINGIVKLKVEVDR